MSSARLRAFRFLFLGAFSLSFFFHLGTMSKPDLVWSPHWPWSPVQCSIAVSSSSHQAALDASLFSRSWLSVTSRDHVYTLLFLDHLFLICFGLLSLLSLPSVQYLVLVDLLRGFKLTGYVRYLLQILLKSVCQGCRMLKLKDPGTWPCPEPRLRILTSLEVSAPRRWTCLNEDNPEWPPTSLQISPVTKQPLPIVSSNRRWPHVGYFEQNLRADRSL